MMKNNKKFFWFIGGICFIAIVLEIILYFSGGFLTRPSNSKIGASSLIESTPVPKVYGATAILKTEDGEARQSSRGELVVFISVDSKQTDVVGYDLTFRYPQNTLQFKNASSLLSDFTLFTYEKDDIISLTGSKSLSSKNQTVFSGNNIVKLTFQPLESKTATIELLDEYKKTKSQIVDPQSKSKFISPTSLVIELF